MDFFYPWASSSTSSTTTTSACSHLGYPPIVSWFRPAVSSCFPAMSHSPPSTTSSTNSSTTSFTCSPTSSPTPLYANPVYKVCSSTYGHRRWVTCNTLTHSQNYKLSRRLSKLYKVKEGEEIFLVKIYLQQSRHFKLKMPVTTAAGVFILSRRWRMPDWAVTAVHALHLLHTHVKAAHELGVQEVLGESLRIPANINKYRQNKFIWAIRVSEIKKISNTR